MMPTKPFGDCGLSRVLIDSASGAVVIYFDRTSFILNRL